MIKKVKVNGKPATAIYVRSDMEPVDSEEDAEMIKIIFDNGDIMFAVPNKEDNPDES